ncbi:MAG TPA: Fur family transcriptional regulator [Planctomycetaceae bacterium]|nr:Fur family transcriptional regulator [Planctomycetaceae bacterium]
MNPTTEARPKKIPEGELPAVAVSASPREKLEEFLATRGLRLTQERSAILDEVFSSHLHFDGDELATRLASRPGAVRVSRATVYRTLRLMVEAGLLRRVARPNGREVYEHDYGYPQHDHFICRVCGELIEFQNGAISEILEEVAAKNSFRVSGHRLEVYGLCSKCSRPQRRHTKLDLL